MERSDSIKKRYFYKLFVRIVSLFLYAAKVSLVPRALGPTHYGDFTFLSGIFTSITNFFELGTSNAFLNYSAKNRKSGAAVIFYTLYSLAIPIILIIFIVAVNIFGYEQTFFPDQRMQYVYLAALFGWLLWLSNIVFGYSDAKGLTVVSEIVRLKVRVFFTLVLVALFIFQYLDLTTFLIFCILETIGFVVYTIIYCAKDADHSEYSWTEFKKSATALTRYFYQYSSPLFLYSVVVLLAGLWGRWFLQVVGGSTEQGFFGLSDKISSISLIFTVSMVPIFMSEFSKAHGNSDFETMRKLFRDNAKLFYFLASVLAIFFVFHTPEITRLFAGDEFSGAILPIAIMAFYPMYQTYAQMNGAVYYSTERTKLYRNIGIGFILVGIIANYFFVAPRNFFLPGLGLGAVGAAMAGVLVVIFSTNIQLLFNCRYLKLKYREFVWHQVISVLILLASMSVGKTIIKTVFSLFGLDLGVWIIFPSGILYCAFVVVLVFFVPRLTVGFDRPRTLFYVRMFLAKIKSIYQKPPLAPSGVSSDKIDM
ncbi:hypothetical protein HZB94_02885 [Candidatus Falkowbacteria bacterium]|nr:hypothetical protein [Candidatus Falkowbacteria bacterium]